LDAFVVSGVRSSLGTCSAQLYPNVCPCMQRALMLSVPELPKKIACKTDQHGTASYCLLDHTHQLGCIAGCYFMSTGRSTRALRMQGSQGRTGLLLVSQTTQCAKPLTAFNVPPHLLLMHACASTFVFSIPVLLSCCTLATSHLLPTSPLLHIVV
jgi:hypothetical protein